MKNSWTLKVELDEWGEPAITLPEEMIKQVGWKVGDVVEWSKLEDNSWQLKLIS